MVHENEKATAQNDAKKTKKKLTTSISKVNQTKKFLAETEEKKPAKKKVEESSDEDDEDVILNSDDEIDEEVRDFIVPDNEVSSSEDESEDERPKKPSSTKKNNITDEKKTKPKIDNSKVKKSSPKTESSVSKKVIKKSSSNEKRKAEEDVDRKSRAKKVKTNTASSDSDSDESVSSSQVMEVGPSSNSSSDFFMIDTEATIDSWFEDFRENILSNQDNFKVFLEDFKGCDFISNYGLRHFSDEESFNSYIASLKNKFFTQDEKKSSEAGKEIIRLLHAQKIRQVLAEHNINIVGFDSENRCKATSKSKKLEASGSEDNVDNATVASGSKHARRLPSGYVREEDKENKTTKDKIARIVYIGEKFQMGKSKNNTVVIPNVKVYLLPKHTCYYSTSLVPLLRESAKQKKFNDVQNKNPESLLPLKDFYTSSYLKPSNVNFKSSSKP